MSVVNQGALEDPQLTTELSSERPAAGMEPLPWLLLSAALDDPRMGHLIFDSELRLLYMTSQTPRLLELENRDPVNGGGVLHLLARSALDQSCLENAKAYIAEFSPDLPERVVLLRSQDQSRSVRMRLRAIGQQYRVATFEPVSPAEANKEQVVELALRDSLTGLASRSYFESTLTQILERRPDQPLTLILIDLDRFKAVNDTLGHGAGDALLRLAAERLKAAVRKDDIVARLGGDEFAVLMQQPAANAEEVKAVAGRILDLVQRTYLIEGQLVNVGTSIGIALAPSHGNTYSALMRNADLALYHSKQTGRATYSFFDEQMERRAQARRTSELELRRALALRQLEVFYQPQVNTVTNRLVGFEALLRWRHPERGMIPPADFLPVAEEIGLIVPIGEWVLRAACKEATGWPCNVTVAVNASPLQIETGSYAESVKRALATTGLPGERLEIEVTEGIMLRNDEVVLKTLHDLRAMKVRIAMDDFGTGYASLSQLARFPFDKIKIDKSLAGFSGNSPKQRAIVRAITALGDSLGVSTLAEGVEDAEQVARLKVDGCTAVQGYFFGKPLPASELKTILERFC